MRPLGSVIKCDHYYVICSGPLDNGSVIIFNLTTLDFDSDRTCVVTPADYADLDHDSVVAYGFGELASPQRLARLEMLSSGVDHPAVSAELLERILQGASDSKATPSYIKDEVRKVLARNKIASA